MASGTRRVRNRVREEDSLIGLHPDEEAAVIHALRQSLKATRDIAAPREDEDCYLPLSTDLRDMKAIQTLLVRKRKWKAKAKPMVAFTDLKDASLTKEGECSVLQGPNMSLCEECSPCGGEDKKSKQMEATPPPLLCQLRIPKGLCHAEIEQLYKDIQIQQGIYSKFKIHDRKRSFADTLDKDKSMEGDNVDTLHTSIPLRLLQQGKQSKNLEKESKVQQERMRTTSSHKYVGEDVLTISTYIGTPSDDGASDIDFMHKSEWAKNALCNCSADSTSTGCTQSVFGSPYPALRKFAQSPMRFSDTRSELGMPPKRSDPSLIHSTIAGRLSTQCFPAGRPLTEDFFAFLCVRGVQSDIIPNHLKLFEQSWTYAHLDVQTIKHKSSARWLHFTEEY